MSFGGGIRSAIVVPVLLSLALSAPSAAQGAGSSRSAEALRVSRVLVLVKHIRPRRYAKGQRDKVLRATRLAVRRARGKLACPAVRAVDALVGRLNSPATWRRRQVPRSLLRKPLRLLDGVEHRLVRKAGASCAVISREAPLRASHGGDDTGPPVTRPVEVNDQGEEEVEPVRTGVFRAPKSIGASTDLGADPHTESAPRSTAPQRSSSALGPLARAAAGDPIQLFRSSDVGAPGGSSIVEPTSAVGRGVVWYTGNTSVSLSTNGGRTFTTFDPSKVLPDNGMGFCCDQVVSYSSSSDLFVWVSQYWCRNIQRCNVPNKAGNEVCPGAGVSNGSNRIRIAVAQPQALINNAANPGRAWTYWDITPQTLGLPANAWFDRSDLSVSQWNVNFTVDKICAGGGSVLARVPLSRLASRGTVPLSYFFDASASRIAAAQGERASTTYYAGNATTSRARIWSWDAFSPSMFPHEVDHASVPGLNSAVPGSDAADWYSRFGIFPNAVESATVSGRTLYLAQGTGRDICAAKCGANEVPTIKHVFDRPAVLVTRYDVDTWRLLGETWIWHPTIAYGWPVLQTDSAGEVGIGLRAAEVGHNARPVGGFLTPDVQLIYTMPEGLPFASGDYYSLRPGRTGRSFALTAQAVQNDPGGSAMHWSFVEFGRGPSPYVAAPNVRIAAPADLATFTLGSGVAYRADVSDPVDGTLPGGAIRWREDGVFIGSGATLSHVENTVGSHVVTVTATNGDGRSASASITIRVQAPPPPDAPVVAITDPLDGQFACIDAHDAGGSYRDVAFRATATDPGGRPLTFSWTDSVNGGARTQVSTVLSPTLRLYLAGSDQSTTHDLTLTASNGAAAGSRQLRFFIKLPGACLH
ncbi:MAG: hypothetical protein QOE31_3869 [Solirubrobacteraceae bacterium]|nr:hypothetical protein [Solirubrobacteraceae bacterium]